MKNRWFLAVTILLVVPCLLGGCGIAQEKYDSVVAQVTSLQSNLEAAQNEGTKLQSDLTAEQNKSAKLESELSAEKDISAKLQGDLTSVENQVSSLESQVSSLETSISKAKRDLTAAQDEYSNFRSDLDALGSAMGPSLDVLHRLIVFWDLAIQVAAGEITDSEGTARANIWESRMQVSVDTLDNAEVTQLWEDFLLYVAQNENEQAALTLAELQRLLSDLVDKDIEAIEDLLAE